MADSSTALYRSTTLHCPRCRTTTLPTRVLSRCGTCEGSWIPEHSLAEHVGAMQSAPRSALTWSVSTDRLGLPCAVCRYAMQPLLLFEMPVDRCPSHGVWFDKDELAEVLRRSAAYAPRNDARDDSVALAVIEAGGNVAEAAGLGLEVVVESAGVIEAILDVIGGIFSAIDF